MENLFVRELDLSSRALNCLQRNGITSLKELMSLNEDDLLKMRNMGVKTSKEIIDFQEKYKNNEIDDSVIDDSVFQHKNQGDEYEVETKRYISPNAFIFNAFPGYNNLPIYDIMYKDDYGELQNDITLERTGLSVRILNAFKKMEIDGIDTIAKMDKDRIFHVRNLGRNSIQELIDYLSEKAEFVFFSEDEKMQEVDADVDRIYNLIDDNIYSDYINMSLVKNSIIRNIEKSNKNDNLNIIKIEDIIQNEKIIRDLFLQDNVVSDISHYIRRVIEQNDTPQTKQSLHGLFPEFFLKIGLLDLSLDTLLKNGKIHLEDIGYVIDRIKLSDWIITLPEKERIIISLRINNRTLEECGNRIGVTRERVRQIEAKTIKRKPKLFEDYYSHWFKKYYFDLESFKTIFNETDETYYYLNIAYKKGDKSLDLFTSEEVITATIYKNYKTYEVRNCLLIDGEYILNKRYEIQKKLIKLFCSQEPIKVDDFIIKYNEFLTENGYDKYEELIIPSSRALEGRLADYDYVLMGNHHSFRYYPINEVDVSEIIEQIDLTQYKDVEISTLKIFNDNHMLMEDIDIRNEYELHNFLKKTEKIWNNSGYDIRLLRMPFISFGEADRNKQAENLLFQIAPVSYEEFGEFYEMEYGVLARTVLANIGPAISKYYHNGMYEINQPQLEEGEFSFLEDSLSNDFYFIEDVKKIYADQYGQSGVERINPRTLKELHFKVYVDYIIRDTFSSAYDYFYTLFSSKDVFTIEQYDKRLIYVQTANQAIEDLRSSYDILEYEDMKFITYQRLNSVHNDITKDTLIEYVSKVDSYVRDEYFTIHNLVKNGLTDRLHNIGFGEWFNAAIVKNSRKYKFIKSGGNIIFSKDMKKITTVDFLRYVITKIRKMNIYDFIVYLKEAYNVNLSKDKIIYMIKDTDLYYNSIMEKIYINRDEYYEEV